MTFDERVLGGGDELEAAEQAAVAAEAIDGGNADVEVDALLVRNVVDELHVVEYDLKMS